ARRRGVREAARITTLWAAGAAALLGAVLYFAGADFIDLMTVDAATRALARRYLPWAALAPLAGVWSFQLDGIFVGATRTAEMRTAMLLALGAYLGAWWLATPWGNHGLWAALIVSYLARAGFLLPFYPRLLESVGERTPPEDPSP
ncbi:MAG: MATE family efflux transporter, partial [Gammaproteobacteria bacterium]